MGERDAPDIRIATAREVAAGIRKIAHVLAGPVDPNTGAAGFLQPGTGQSCLGAFLRGRPEAKSSAFMLAPRPSPEPSAPTTAARARSSVSRSIIEVSWLVKEATRVAMFIGEDCMR